MNKSHGTGAKSHGMSGRLSKHRYMYDTMEYCIHMIVFQLTPYLLQTCIVIFQLLDMHYLLLPCVRVAKKFGILLTSF